MNTSVKSFIDELQGYEVAHVWRGYGSAIFLELGLLANNEHNNKKGEATVCIEWSWRIDSDNEIILGTWDDDSQIDKSVDLLRGRIVKEISFFLNIKEIDIEFDDGKHLISFSTVAGAPQWQIRNKDNQYLSFKDGTFNNDP